MKIVIEFYLASGIWENEGGAPAPSLNYRTAWRRKEYITMPSSSLKPTEAACRS